VLSGSVHLAWRDEHRASAIRYELQRRSKEPDAAGDWSPVGPQPIGPLDPHVDDPGLAASAYEYRIRGLYRASASAGEHWSAWSDPTALELTRACEGLEPPSGALPTVVADDRNGDGRYTGADLVSALKECSRRGGCILEALAAVYDDVAILLSDGDRTPCVPERSACLALPFENGLVIQGHGGATVFRSPLWKAPYRPVAVLELWKRPDLRIWVRNLVLDGRKTEQADPIAGRNNSITWWHYGFQTWNQWGDHTLRNRNGCFHNVVIRNFMSRGLSLMDVERWVIDHCRIEDIGCLEGLTDCPGLTIPDAYQARGYKAAGHGINIGWYADDVLVAHNRIARVTKYSIGVKDGSDGSETSIRRLRVEDNAIVGTGSVGVFLAGVAEGRFRRNLVEGTHVRGERPEHVPYYDTFAISCMGRVERTSFVENRLRDSAGIAVNWQCSGEDNVISDTVIEGSCREKNPTTCVPGSPGQCYGYADLNIGRGAGGTLRLVRDEIRSTRCATPLEANALLELEIEGGRFGAGPHASRGVTFRDTRLTIWGGARFEDLGLSFSNAHGVVAPSVEVLSPRKRFVRDRASRVLVCAEEPKECERLCAASPAPEWCAE
jgi:hypothetical protein